MQDEKVTIQVAAKALNVTPKTVHQWLKVGTLKRVKEGNRTYILMDEVRALRQNRVITSKSEVTTSEAKPEQVTSQGNDMVPISRTHYDGLLTRLGQLEANQQLLLEYRGNIEQKDKELAEAKATITKARNELQRLLEVKQDAERKAKVVLDQRAALEAKERELAEIRAENARLKRLKWWERILFIGRR